MGDIMQMAGCYTMIGNIYMNSGDFDSSRMLYDLGIQTLKSLQQKQNSFSLSQSLGDAYANLGGMNTLNGTYNETFKYLDSALSIYKKINSAGGMCIYYLNVALLYEKAPETVLLQHHIPVGSRYAKVIEAGLKAYKIAGETGYADFKMQAQGLLYQGYKGVGDYKAANDYLEALVAARDSATGLETQKKVTQQEAKFEYEKKAAVLSAAQEKKDIKHRLVRNSLLAGVGLLAFFSVVVYRQRNKVNGERKRSEELLLNILPATVAGELKATGKAAAQRFDHISVLFTDFVNFTGKAEALSAEALVGKLNECFTAFDNIIERHGLEKIKTIGDAYMAVCGLPISKEDHAARAIAAAREILDFMRNIGMEQDSFGIRIGINSGSVVAGIVGVKKFAYDIWGDTVNTAARMEQRSEPGKINISQSTYDLVKDKIACIYRGEIEAKNKGKLKMYFVGD